MEALLADEAREAAAARAGRRQLPARCAGHPRARPLLPAVPARRLRRTRGAGRGLLALDELGDRRLEILLRAQEHEAAPAAIEAQEQAAQASERTPRAGARLNEALRRSEAQSQHRAEQIALLQRRGAPAWRGMLEPERLMQEAAETIQARMNHTYVAVVVLDDEGMLVGRWAGRAGRGPPQRRAAPRARPGGVIGRALRKRAPQVVADVSQDPDYYADVPGTRSEMVIPLLEDGEVVGAMDFQSESAGAFDLDEVAVGETIAEFLVVALRNARLYAEAPAQAAPDGRTPPTLQEERLAVASSAVLRRPGWPATYWPGWQPVALHHVRDGQRGRAAGRHGRGGGQLLPRRQDPARSSGDTWIETSGGPPK